MADTGKKPELQGHTQAERARALLAKRGMLRLRELAEAGIAEETMARLVRHGEVSRLSRGLYQLADTEVDAAHSLVEASKLVPKGIICLISALQYHGLTTQLSSQVWMAIQQNAWKPSISYPPIKSVRFGEQALTKGVEIHQIEGVDVRIYNVAKTVVDCFRYRNKIGMDIALEALRESLHKRRCTANELWKMAQELHVLNVMKPYLESMTYNAA